MALKPTRREFVKIGSMSAAALLLAKERVCAAFSQTQPLLKFGPDQQLRRFGSTIPLATKDTSTYPGVDFYQIAMREFTDKLHPSLGRTPLRGYGDAASTNEFTHLGGAIVATVGRPVRVRWHNELVDGGPTKLGATGIPVDPTVVIPYTSHGNDRVSPHLHGGLVPWTSDGGPFHWFGRGHTGAGPGKFSVCGTSVVPWLPEADGSDVLNTDYWYPNNQTARFMWYHDHAVGITRLNAYAGLASGYLLVDPTAESVLLNDLGVLESSQIPLVVQDKIFNADGSLWYPDTYDTQFFALAKGFAQPSNPSIVPEFWGDTMLVNGTAYPYVDVEPRRYRLRILNACNTRFLSLRIVGALGRTFPANTEPDPAIPGPALTVIGTEGGFLDGLKAPKGVVYNNTAVMPLVLAPAERADIIVDFSKVKNPTGKPLYFILYNDAPVPFPGGTPLADFFPQNKKLAVPPQPGYGPNTRTLLQFRLVPMAADASADPPVNRNWSLVGLSDPEPPLPTTLPRDLALYETIDNYGRLTQNLGDLQAPMTYTDHAPTENLAAGTVEVWRVFNLTADTHPIHFHYFNVRVISRQPFSFAGAGTPVFNGAPFPPEPCELGWKETVRMNPGECTTLLVDVPPLTRLAPAGVTIPESPRLAAAPYNVPAAHEYVWHCHILEHEEHDMMRPLIVTASQV